MLPYKFNYKNCLHIVISHQEENSNP
uniref:Uncharacterized protein n=1 Tax=Arundo donax TaxID=35708 RepID=A0A0A9AP35_ARUDO